MKATLNFVKNGFAVEMEEYVVFGPVKQTEVFVEVEPLIALIRGLAERHMADIQAASQQEQE